MKPRLLLLIVFGFCCLRQPLCAQEPIPDSLRTNAHAVMRSYEETFIVENIGLATHRYHYVITILDALGQDNATVSVFHDQYTQIANMTAVVYDATGKQVKQMKRGDVSDVSYITSGTLFADNKVQTADLNYAKFPYTIDISYELKTTNLLFYPSFFPQRFNGVSVQRASFEVIVPNELGLRYKTFNGLSEPAVNELILAQKPNKSYLWSVLNLPAMQTEDYTPSQIKMGLGVRTAPVRFGIDNVQGNMASWHDLGLFHYNLNKNRDVLPDNIINDAKNLVANETDITQKIKKIYTYVQAHTRYVSVQLGIGGWQTFEAMTVADKGYGDCKALSNYTKALLKAVGITSYQALVNADGIDQIADFPLSNFNHVILYVPTPKDTVWLECTSQTQAFGYLGDFTGDRYALLLTPDGGKLVKTPQYTPNDNRQQRRIDLTILDDGDATATAHTVYSGLQQDLRSEVATQLNPDEQKEWLYKNLKISGLELQKTAYVTHKNRIPTLTESLSFTVRSFVNKSGNRAFVTPNFMTAWSTLLPNKIRKNDFEWPEGFVDADTVKISIPTGYKVEQTPVPVKHETKFGKYETNTEVKNNQIWYYRQLMMPKGTYTPSQYNSIVDFFRKIARTDKAQIVLVKQD